MVWLGWATGVRVSELLGLRWKSIDWEDQSGDVRLQEAKSSATAKLTDRQKAAHPEIQKSGATVVGKGKPDYPGGTKIQPTKVEIVRPNKDQ
jgi:integrase